ncbi:MAG: DUF4041 domain-containing protein [Tepidisphaeraceae bacterium]|jgi:hypothetical protein
MTIVLTITSLVCLVFLVTFFIANKSLEKRAIEAEQQAEGLRLQFDSDVIRIHKEAQAALAESQKLVDQQSEDMKRESARVRQHYHDEARKIQIAANAMVARVLKEFEPLRKYEKLKDAEAEVQRQLAEALNEATSMRTEAKAFLDSARTTATEERTQAKQSVKSIHEQADARLDQAIRDAGRIIAEAEKRAKEIGGDAYAALQEKRMLEEAAQAMRNIVDGYGDRYLVPTHSLLDDLAAEYSYDAAGQSLASAREQSKRMVEQGQAAACDYVEANRRTTAIQFVIHAFNGSVDAILTRTKSDNYGILEQKIRDVYAIVNLDGSAFRNARILPAYLDARLAELKWAVTVQELAMRDREEQRYLKEQERDRQKAEEERLEQLREAEKEKERAAKEQEFKRAALAEAESRLAQAHSEERAKLEQEVQRLKQDVMEVSQKLEEATQKELTIAQQTSKGRIYVISNVGSFGEGVYKIGLTRRQAQERVDELSSASVPFEFDIHAVIETDDAPALEQKIQQQFLEMRINKINLRKEFFRVSLDDIRERVESLEQGKDFLGKVTWSEKARAQQYYDSLDIERDPIARERWLKRTRLLVERRRHGNARMSASNGDAEGDRDIEPQTTGTSQIT